MEFDNILNLCIRCNTYSFLIIKCSQCDSSVCHEHIRDHECLPTKFPESASVKSRTKSKLCNTCHVEVKEFCHFACKCGNFTCLSCRWDHIAKCAVYLLDLKELKRSANIKLYGAAKRKITTTIDALLIKKSQKESVLLESLHDKEASLQYYQQCLQNLQTGLSDLIIKKTKTTDDLVKLKIPLVALVTRKKAGANDLDTHICVILNNLCKMKKELANTEKIIIDKEHMINSYLKYVVDLENKINNLKLMQDDALQWLANHSTSSNFLNTVLVELDTIIPEEFGGVFIQNKYISISEHVDDIAAMLSV